ncbi:hypothetical protein KRX52_12925, partial [Pseudomonas sp. MAP12]
AGLFAFAGVLRIGEGQLLHARGAPEGLAAISPDREVFFRPSLGFFSTFQGQIGWGRWGLRAPTATPID